MSYLNSYTVTAPLPNHVTFIILCCAARQIMEERKSISKKILLNEPGGDGKEH